MLHRIQTMVVVLLLTLVGLGLIVWDVIKDGLRIIGETRTVRFIKQWFYEGGLWFKHETIYGRFICMCIALVGLWLIDFGEWIDSWAGEHDDD